MRRVRQLSVGKRVGCEQVAEFVMDRRHRHRKEPQDCEAREYRHNGDRNDGRPVSGRKARSEPFRRSQPAVPEPRRDYRRHQKRNQNQFVEM
jgi:hypothetical protein